MHAFRVVVTVVIAAALSACTSESGFFGSSCFDGIELPPNYEYSSVGTDTEGRIAITATDPGLLVFEIDENHVGTMVTTVPGNFGYSRNSGVAMDGRTAFFNSGQDLIAVDLTTPSQPQELGRVTFVADHGHSMVRNGKRLYRAEGPNIRVIDVSNPGAMVETGLVTGTPTIQAMHLHDGRLFISHSDRQLSVYSLANPDLPAYESFIEVMSPRQRRWGFKDHYAYYSRAEGIGIVDIGTTPPSQVGIVAFGPPATGEFFRGLFVIGDSLLGPGTDFDIRDPAMPKQLERPSNCADIRDVAYIDDERALVMQYDGEFSIRVVRPD